ncbi:hypothetical protein N0V84_004170 [Fusarium piperis]|uniref:LysM domain-containing protein n=1 Tax=Fusarium piperis TaxID=1435070 RepID=A0A9W8WGE8_9HYPO|nr:hypothetical protein N0V84_004170 [Fusarium piperis]
MAPAIKCLISLLLLSHSTLILPVAASPHPRHHVLHNHSQKRADYGSITLFNATTLADTSLSKACIATLGAPLECSGYILDDDMLYTWGGFSDQNLVPLCTSACSKSIESYRSKVIKVCANDVYTDPEVNTPGYVPGTNVPNDIYNAGGSSLRPIALADYYFLNYKLLCLKDDKSKAFCYSETGDGADSTLGHCSSCNIGAMRVQLEDAATFDQELLSEYSSLIKSCKTTAAPVTTPSPVFLDNTRQSATSATCSGSSAAVLDNQSCDDFALAHNISTSRLLSINHLIGGCVDWPGESPELCIEGNCQPYRVKKGDTCAKVARAHDITQTQMLRWNYFIDPYCRNWEQQIGHVICVSDPSGYKPPKVKAPGAGAGIVTAAAPLPTNAQPESNKNCGKWYMPQKGQGCSELASGNGITLHDFHFLNPQINANCSNMWADTMYCVKAVGHISTYVGYGGNTATATTTKKAKTKTINLNDLPEATHIPWSATTTSTGFPLASGSVKGCKVKFNNDYGNIPCEVAARAYGIDLYHWLRWNPSVLGGSDRYVPDNCTLENNTQYCAIAWDPLKVQPAAEPDKYEPAPTGATVNATKECEDWYVVSEGETCEEVIEENKMPLWALFNWNPSIGSECENMQVNAAYCVLGPGWQTIDYAATQTPNTNPSSTATTEASTATSTAKSSTVSTAKDTAKTTTKNTATKAAPGPPAPTQSGIVENCQEWYVAEKGDGCQAIADQAKITLKQFYEWNPAVGTDCKNLWVKEAYCVSAGRK